MYYQVCAETHPIGKAVSTIFSSVWSPFAHFHSTDFNSVVVVVTLASYTIPGSRID